MPDRHGWAGWRGLSQKTSLVVYLTEGGYTQRDDRVTDPNRSPTSGEGVQTALFVFSFGF